jgi:tripartite-type tricarboxylate transporter receptor subunit TctC
MGAKMMHQVRNVLLSVALALACVLTAVTGASAQNGPIKILVGLPPGGAVDIGARLLGQKLQASLGQTVVVENRPGASTRLATQALKASEPNGQTLMVAPDAIVVLYPHVFREVGYDPLKDLTPISKLLFWSYGFAVPAASPAKTFTEFVALAKADPKFAQFASPSTGSSQHILGLQLGGLIGARLDHIPFKGAADAINAMLGNSVPSAILTLGELTNLHQGGKARVLATFTAARTTDLNEVPTFAELGYPAMRSNGVVSVFGPAGMKPELVERISRAVRDAVADPDVKARIAAMGMEAQGSTSQELDAYDRSELERWRNVVKASGYVPE